MDLNNIAKKMDILTLIIFKDICEEKLLSKAAEKNFIALSAASKRISDLESIIGTPLFLRSKKGMVLTSAGENLLYHCNAILDSINKASIELAEYKFGIKGFVRLQANLSTIIQYLPEDLASFTHTNPFIKIELQERPSIEIIDNLSKDIADLGVCVAETKHPDFEYDLYHCDKLVVVVPADNYLADKTSILFNEIVHHDFIGLHNKSAINRILTYQAETLNTHIKIRILVSSFDAVCRMTQVKMGISILPQQVFQIFGVPLGLKSISLLDDWANRELYLISKSNDSLTPTALALKSHLLSAKA